VFSGESTPQRYGRHTVARTDTNAKKLNLGMCLLLLVLYSAQLSIKTSNFLPKQCKIWYYVGIFLNEEPRKTPMSKDIQSSIDMNPCEKCRASNLPFCKCAGVGGGGGGDDGKDAENGRENAYKTRFESGAATQKENKSESVGLTKSTQQEKVALQPTPFPTKPAPSVKKGNDKQQKEDETDNVGASTENKPFHPTPFPMTMELNPYRR
jgi:hypothetical protein